MTMKEKDLKISSRLVLLKYAKEKNQVNGCQIENGIYTHLRKKKE